MTDHRNDPIPAKPDHWLESTEIEYSEGVYPSCLCLRHIHDNEVTPFVVHLAYVMGGNWHYHNGSYCMSLTAAQEAYASRSK